jgi:hypothetical protein
VSRLRSFHALTLLLCWFLANVITAAEPSVSFERDVQPLLTSLGCNQGACHGKARGQNGFQLSLFGFDPDFDYAAITLQARGRRIFPASPQYSLLLMKGTGQIAHGGGIRLEVGDADYQILLNWISQGYPRQLTDEPKLVNVTIAPTERYFKTGESQPLQVTAHYSDNSTRNVTARTAFQSSEAALVAVDKQGIMKAGPLPGEATIMARYQNIITTTRAIIPLLNAPDESFYATLPRKNFIDDLVWAKLQTLGLTPSKSIDDAKFLRRVHLDIIGRLPTPLETRTFLADSSTEKRHRLIDSLLERPEYADHWAAKWADLLRPNPYRVGIKAVMNYDQWVRDAFRKNKPYDHFVRELITAQGSTWQNGATVLFRDRRDPPEITTLVTQLFLGIRLECAKCHHHPFEKWSQDDFYSFAAYFARLGHYGQGVSPPISGGEEIIFLKQTGEVRHPLTNRVLDPRPLFGNTPPMAEQSDPRVALAHWLTDEDNPFFAQVLVNRVWAELMGRGLVEPVDDLRATNPPTNPALLNALAEDFRRHGYDLKHLIRTICSAHVYTLSSIPNERNAGDQRNYSRHYRSRMRAEVLHDAISDVLDTPDAFAAMPAGSRANQLWTTRVGSVFLDTFGRPNPNQDPPCERSPESTVTQTLHLMNSPQLHNRVTASTSRAAKLAATDLKPDLLIEELYLLTYSRLPSASEREVGQSFFATTENRGQAVEDLLWALLNTPEFSFQD